MTAAVLAFRSFLPRRLMSSCDSRLSSKAWAPLWVASLQALRSAARCSLPLTGMSQARRVLEGVFVALCLASLTASAASQFRTEDLFWKTAVLHSYHVARPSELGFMIRTSTPGIQKRRSTSWLVNLSSQEMHRRQRRWNWSSFLKCLR